MRLAAVSNGLAKPLVPVGGKSILARSLEVLRASGIEEVTIVVGYQGALVRDTAERLWPGIGVVENDNPGATGSMRSLALAWARLRDTPVETVMVVEGDILYGPEAVAALRGAAGPDTVLASSPTGAGDEVWILGEGTRIGEISKQPVTDSEVLGELVGLCLLTRTALDRMADTHVAGGASTAMEQYEERISALCPEIPFRVQVEDDLAWAEIDDPSHLARAEAEVLPRLEGR